MMWLHATCATELIWIDQFCVPQDADIETKMGHIRESPKIYRLGKVSRRRRNVVQWCQSGVMHSTKAHIARFAWLNVLFMLFVFPFQVFLVLAPVVDYESGDIMSMRAATKIVDLYQAEFSEWRVEEGSPIIGFLLSCKAEISE